MQTDSNTHSAQPLLEAQDPMEPAFSFLLLLCLVLLAQAHAAPFDAPVDTPFEFPLPYKSPFSQKSAAKPAQVDFTIHPSCSTAQSATLHRAFSELRSVATAAINYIQIHGSQDPLFIMYFGKGADKSVPVATYNRIAKGDKSRLTFRCDDPDRLCIQHPDWNGHWRGSKAKDETVVCKLSFTSRVWLDKMCQPEINNINKYWALDLVHRSLHLPAIGQGLGKENLAGDHSEILQLAQKSPKEAVRNAHTLQAFAFQVVSRSSKHPEGCVAQMQM